MRDKALNGLNTKIIELKVRANIYKNEVKMH